jgi:ABC-type branched-subunit amino acid transport system ATPase component/branched-subunit amino acid ABC-type transport system permease component
MNAILPFIISGIAVGSIYGLAATGVVITYKSAGILNFAQGAIAAVAAYLFYWLHVQESVSWPISFVICFVILGPLVGLGMELLGRYLAQRTVTLQIVGTIGLILIVQGLATIKYGTDALDLPSYLPQGSFRLGGVNIGYDDLTIFLVAVVCMAGLYALFRTRKVGLPLRALVDDAALLGTRGVSPVATRRVAWVVGSSFACLSGLLIAPEVGIQAVLLTYLVVQAMGAVAFGYFSNFPLTFVGGLVIGIAANLSTKYVVSVDWLTGLPASLPFIVLLLALLTIRRRRLTSLAGPPAQRPTIPYRAPAAAQLIAAVIVVGALAAVPAIVGTKLPEYTVGLTQTILVLSLGLAVRTSGQVSLGHPAFAAVGALAFSQFALNLGLPWGVALLLGCLVAAPAGALVAIPAIRLSGVYLAIATLAFGIMMEQLVYPLPFAFTPLYNGRSMPRPSFASSDSAFYYLVLVLLLVVAVVMVGIHQSRLGRLLRGTAEAPVAVSAMGLSVNVIKVLVFSISAFFAGLAGALYGSTIHFAVSTDPYYSSFNGLVLLAILAIAPMGVPWYGLFGGVAAVIPAYIDSANTGYWLNVIFGAFAVMVALQGETAPGPRIVKAQLERLRRRGGRVEAMTAAEAAVLTPEHGVVNRPPESTGLVVKDLTVRFGGLVAVAGLNFAAPLGRITGLIGPNGAGKTTTFDACTGLNTRTGGTVSFRDQDVTGRPAAARARLGIGRTFQRMALCEGLTVGENIALAPECRSAGRNPLAQILGGRAASSSTSKAARDAARILGIEALEHAQAGSLSTGHRRLVELARCIAGEYELLLLDEPSSGLDQHETAKLRGILQDVITRRHCGILLVEHDMSLVMSTCDYVYVLDYGRLIFEGTPEDAAADPGVRAAYLGDPVQAGTGAESPRTSTEAL